EQVDLIPSGIVLVHLYDPSGEFRITHLALVHVPFQAAKTLLRSGCDVKHSGKNERTRAEAAAEHEGLLLLLIGVERPVLERSRVAVPRAGLGDVGMPASCCVDDIRCGHGEPPCDW